MKLVCYCWVNVYYNYKTKNISSWTQYLPLSMRLKYDIVIIMKLRIILKKSHILKINEENYKSGTSLNWMYSWCDNVKIPF